MSDEQAPVVEGLSLEKLAEETKHLFGQVVLLYSAKMVVFCGVAEDEMDLYYVVREKDGMSFKEYWATAVGHIDDLKGVLSDDVYDRVESHQKLTVEFPTEFLMLFDEGEKVAPYNKEVHDKIRQSWYIKYSETAQLDA